MDTDNSAVKARGGGSGRAWVEVGKGGEMAEIQNVNNF